MRVTGFQIRRGCGRWVGRLPLLLLACCAAAQMSSPGYAPADARQDEVTVKGTVVNAVTGEPIRRALVQAGEAYAFSGPDGAFAFPHMKPGQRLWIAAKKPNFFSEAELSRGQTTFTSGGPEVGPGMAPVTVRLWPQAVIAGRVLSDDGEPIENAQVTLTAVGVDQGHKVVRREGNTQTDENGNYRIAQLRPGSYYIAVLPRNESIAVLSKQGKKGFPAMVYYPDAGDLSGAAPISLISGQQQAVDFSIKNVPLYSVSGNVIGIPLGHFADVSLTDLQGEILQLPLRSVGTNGHFEVLALPAGKYLARAQGADAAGRRFAGEMELTVATDIAGVRLPVSPLATIPVVERFETSPESNRPGADRSRSVYLRLTPTRPFPQRLFFSAQHEVGGERTDSVDNVFPGSYWVEPSADGAWYVQSMSSGNTDLLHEPLVVAADGQAPPIEVVLRDDAAILRASLSATADTAKKQPAWMLVVPSGSGHRPVGPPQPLMGTEASLSGLAPGDYDVYAFDEITDLEYNNPEVVAQFSNRATHVTLSARSRSKVTLDVIRRAP
jgi:hypothetical protein